MVNLLIYLDDSTDLYLYFRLKLVRTMKLRLRLKLLLLKPKLLLTAAPMQVAMLAVMEVTEHEGTTDITAMQKNEKTIFHGM